MVWKLKFFFIHRKLNEVQRCRLEQQEAHIYHILEDYLILVLCFYKNWFTPSSPSHQTLRYPSPFNLTQGSGKWFHQARRGRRGSGNYAKLIAAVWRWDFVSRNQIKWKHAARSRQDKRLRRRRRRRRLQQDNCELKWEVGGGTHVACVGVFA